jgi:23S rRNA (uridine2552-2'-O)-methyltransferase
MERMKRKKEYYSRAAEEEGYRSRAAFKLVQINQKFKLMGEGDAILDLGCSPGGWSQVAREIVGEEGFVLGVDLQKMKHFEGVDFIQGDIFQAETLEKIKKKLDRWGVKGFDAVLSDMAPKFMGIRSVDVARSIELVNKALDIARETLKEKGCFVCKVFEGEDVKVFVERTKNFFESSKRFFPKATKKHSSELYIIAENLKLR